MADNLTKVATAQDSIRMSAFEATKQIMALGHVLDPEFEGESRTATAILVGPPGVSKTASTKAAAKAMAEEQGLNFVEYEPGVQVTEKDFLYIHMNMSGFSPIRLSGIPTIVGENDGNIRTVYSTPDFAIQGAKAGATMYCLDEFFRAQDVGALLSFVNEGHYCDTTANKRGSIFVCLSNEGSARDGTDIFRPDSAMINRGKLIFVKGDVESWRENFANTRVHPAVLAYCSSHQELFEGYMKDTSSRDGFHQFPTLRSVTNCSDSLKGFERRRKGSGSLAPEERAFLYGDMRGYLGTKAGPELLDLYDLAFAEVIPALKTVMPPLDSGKSPEPVPEPMLSILKSVAANETIAPDTLGKAYLYAEYLPPMALAQMETVAKAVKANPENFTPAKEKKAMDLVYTQIGLAMAELGPALQTMALRQFMALTMPKPESRAHGIALVHAIMSGKYPALTNLKVNMTNIVSDLDDVKDVLKQEPGQ